VESDARHCAGVASWDGGRERSCGAMDFFVSNTQADRAWAK
jgi:hypothetical protein